jgi:putative hemolysin
MEISWKDCCEIADEYMKKKNIEEVEQLTPDTWLVPGDMEIDRLADEYNIQLPEGDYQTVAGLILDRLAKIPHQGQIINIEGYRIQVLQVTDRKLLKVKIHRIKPRGNV